MEVEATTQICELVVGLGPYPLKVWVVLVVRDEVTVSQSEPSEPGALSVPPPVVDPL